MSVSLLELPSRDNGTIDLTSVLKQDIFPWLFGAGGVLVLYFAAVAFISQAGPVGKNSFDLAAMTFYQRQFVAPLFILAATFAAHRSKDFQLWLMALLLLIFVMPQKTETLATALLPNTIFAPAVALIGLLAAGRMIEYAYLRHTGSLKARRMTLSAWAGYSALLLASTFFSIPLIHGLFI